MPFEFVDNRTVIGRAARRRIRSHVAVGRNAGKTLVRPSRKKALGLRFETVTAIVRVPKLVEDARSLESSEEVVPEIERQVGHGLSVLSFPEQLTLKSKRLVQRAFSFISGPRHAPELSNALDTTGGAASIWVQFMFLDEAYFHCAVAVSVTALNNLVIKQEGPMEAMKHLSHAFRLINERLSGIGAISDPTIAVVVVMSQYERVQGQYRRGLVHLEGLQRMVELRGGMSQLTREKPCLAQKIFRADLEYSLYLGSATRFSIEDVMTSSTAIFGLPNGFRRQENQKSRRILDSWVLMHLSADLQNLLIDVTNLAWLLNNANAGNLPKVDSYTFHDALLLLGYSLVHIYPLAGPRPANRFENAIHLGLTAFIMTFLRGLDRKITHNPILAELTASAARETFDDKQEDQELQLWLLFIGGAALFRQADDAWLIPKTTSIMNALGLHTWEDIHRTLSKFPWVSVVHDKSGLDQLVATHLQPKLFQNDSLTQSICISRYQHH